MKADSALQVNRNHRAFSLPANCVILRGTQPGYPKPAERLALGLLSLVTFFGEAKKVTEDEERTKAESNNGDTEAYGTIGFYCRQGGIGALLR